MKVFEKPEVEVIKLDGCDIVTCSGELGPGPIHPGPHGPHNPPTPPHPGPGPGPGHHH